MLRLQEDYADFRKQHIGEVKYLRERLECNDRQRLILQQSFTEKEKLMKAEIKRLQSDFAFKDKECKELEEQLLVALTADDTSKGSTVQAQGECQTEAISTVTFADGTHGRVKLQPTQDSVVASREEGKLRFHCVETSGTPPSSACASATDGERAPKMIRHNVDSIRLQIVRFVAELPDEALVQAAAAGEATLKQLLGLLHQHASALVQQDDERHAQLMTLSSVSEELRETVRALATATDESEGESDNDDCDVAVTDVSLPPLDDRTDGQALGGTQPLSGEVQREATATKQAMLLVGAAMESLRRQKLTGFSRSASVQAIASQPIATSHLTLISSQ